MNIELGRLPNGNMVIVSDMRFPGEVQRIEYYRDQHLVMLIYDDPDHEGDLMQYEVQGDAVGSMERSPSILLVTAEPGQELFGYDVPVVHIGDFF